jgi:(E)-4-hydroxy-3-methylbut-2-enyl-diphosphate synthase
VPIRIGVNAGSLDKRLLVKHGKATPQALVDSALWECSLFEEHGFTNLKISVKHHDPLVMVDAYRLLAAACDYPLHLGVTEAGPLQQGTIKSAVAFGILLAEGIGDTLRVSLSAPPIEEVKVGHQILQSLGLRPRHLEIVSCPSCGRAQVDVYTLAEAVTAAFDGFPIPLRIAVMAAWSTAPAKPAKPTSESPPETARVKSSSAAKSSKLSPNTRSSKPSSTKPFTETGHTTTTG